MWALIVKVGIVAFLAIVIYVKRAWVWEKIKQLYFYVKGKIFPPKV